LIEQPESDPQWDGCEFFNDPDDDLGSFDDDPPEVQP